MTTRALSEWVAASRELRRQERDPTADRETPF